MILWNILLICEQIVWELNARAEARAYVVLLIANLCKGNNLFNSFGRPIGL